MKKFYLSVTLVMFITHYSFAQWTTSGNDIYFPSGNVAIGLPDFNLPNYLFSVATQGYTYPDGLLIVKNNGFVGIGDWFMDAGNTHITVDDNTGNIYANSSNSIGFTTNHAFDTYAEKFQVNGVVSIGSSSGTGLNYATGYLGFNSGRDYNGNWTITGDGFHNGDGVTYSGIIDGSICFAPIESSGTSNKTLLDADVRTRTAFRITPVATYAKKVIVELTGWPDYVFKPTYNLKPLSEVKNYIELNHHLPDMPSEKEVADKGLDLGEMNKVLTKKVEELTLYLIEKDKQLAEQKTISQDQEKRLKAIEKLLHSLKSE